MRGELLSSQQKKDRNLSVSPENRLVRLCGRKLSPRKAEQSREVQPSSGCWAASRNRTKEQEEKATLFPQLRVPLARFVRDSKEGAPSVKDSTEILKTPGPSQL